MLALLLKDLYTLKAQMKVFLFILIIFALAFQAEAGAFAVFYATLLPVTSLASVGFNVAIFYKRHSFKQVSFRLVSFFCSEHALWAGFTSD